MEVHWHATQWRATRGSCNQHSAQHQLNDQVDVKPRELLGHPESRGHHSVDGNVRRDGQKGLGLGNQQASRCKMWKLQRLAVRRRIKRSEARGASLVEWRRYSLLLREIPGCESGSRLANAAEQPDDHGQSVTNTASEAKLYR